MESVTGLINTGQVRLMPAKTSGYKKTPGSPGVSHIFSIRELERRLQDGQDHRMDHVFRRAAEAHCLHQPLCK